MMWLPYMYKKGEANPCLKALQTLVYNSKHLCHVGVCVCACVRACVRVCACMHMCVSACAFNVYIFRKPYTVLGSLLLKSNILLITYYFNCNVIYYSYILLTF